MSRGVKNKGEEVVAEAGETRGMRAVIIGAGGAGVRIVSGIEDTAADRFFFDTDASSLKNLNVQEVIDAGWDFTAGMGSGGDVEIGRRAAEKHAGRIRELLEGHDLVFLVGGLGGGTAAGAMPVIASLARRSGLVVICLVSSPFEFEGPQRNAAADAALEVLSAASDVVIVSPNNHLFRDMEKLNVEKAFQKADSVISGMASDIWRLMAFPGLLNADFNDLRSLSGEGAGIFWGWSTVLPVSSGSAAALKRRLDQSYLISEGILRRCSACLVGVIGGPQTSLEHVQQCVAAVRREIGADKTLLRVGLSYVPELEHKATVLILASQSTEAESPQRLVRVESSDSVREKRAGGSHRHSRKNVPEQGSLNLEKTGKGAFRNVEPTIYRGEDLDIPTYQRRGLRLRGPVE